LKKVGGVELIVAEKLPGSTMELVGAGLDRSVQNRRARPAVLSAEAGGLHLEFLNRIDRRQNHEVCPVKEVHGVGVVVDAVEQVVILRRTVTIGGESTGSGVAARIGLRRVHAGRQLRKERKIPAVEGKIVDRLGINNLADRSVLRLQHGNR